MANEPARTAARGTYSPERDGLGAQAGHESHQLGAMGEAPGSGAMGDGLGPDDSRKGQSHAAMNKGRGMAAAVSERHDTAASPSHEFFATCPKGFEKLLAGELAGMGVPNTRALGGQVAFGGTLRDAYRACLWSRLASRVVLVLAHVNAHDSNTLYTSLSNLPWEEHLSLRETFAVDAHGANANLRNTQFVALRAKDAICDRMQAKLGGRPSVDARHPGVSVVVRLRGNKASVGIDLSGTPLFHRNAGRRTEATQGSLRADYAAALLANGGWYRCCRRERPTLVCTFSGSGSVLVEAANVALDRAPGLVRARWGFERWLGHDAAAWDELLEEADARAEAAAVRARSLNLIAIDPRRGMASTARQALRSCGLDIVPMTLAGAEGLGDALAKLPSSDDSGALLATVDLAWLGEDQQAQEVAALGLAGDVAYALPRAVPLSTLTYGPALDAALGLDALEGIDVYVGRDTATLRRYITGLAAAKAEPAARGKKATTKDEGAGNKVGARSAASDASPAGEDRARTTVTLKNGTKVPVLVAASDQFAARLWKVAKLRAKWARKADISCYRVYDADLPDYAVAIDLYQASLESRGADAGKRWAVIQEYAAPKDIDANLAHKRLLDVLAITPHVLNVKPEDVTLRVRRRAKGGSQYADEGARAEGRYHGWLDLAPGCHLVDEGGLVFEVNLAERLDTGLFLDHRDVRAEVREMAKQTKGSKRFLNLFAYTGSATCYAADGGAKHTTTVDMSRTYLDWARRNMARNGFTEREHEFVQADCVSWVTEMRHTKNRWDLVFCDPPTFSNSKRMGRDVFDVQRDHAELLIGISRLLTRDGVCLFSCNLRGFAPDVEKLAKAGVEIRDVTAGTIPEDFKRNAKIHHVYVVRRTPRE